MQCNTNHNPLKRSKIMTQMLDMEARSRLIRKAMEDDLFRQKLVASPRTAVKEELGTTVPSDQSLHVIEAAAQRLDFHIPLKPEAFDSADTASDILDQLTRNMTKLSPELTRRLEAHAKILTKVWTDPEFLNGFMEDPKSIIEDLAEESLPENCEVVVHRDDEKNMFLLLPNLGTDAELTDDELELVSGGLADWVALLLFMAALGAFSW